MVTAALAVEKQQQQRRGKFQTFRVSRQHQTVFHHHVSMPCDNNFFATFMRPKRPKELPPWIVSRAFATIWPGPCKKKKKGGGEVTARAQTSGRGRLSLTYHHCENLPRRRGSGCDLEQQRWERAPFRRPPPCHAVICCSGGGAEPGRDGPSGRPPDVELLCSDPLGSRLARHRSFSPLFQRLLNDRLGHNGNNRNGDGEPRRPAAPEVHGGSEVTGWRERFFCLLKSLVFCKDYKKAPPPPRHPTTPAAV